MTNTIHLFVLYISIVYALFIILTIFTNRILLNEKYQSFINIGFFYYLFCFHGERKLFHYEYKNISRFIASQDHILDFGCGPGILSSFFNTNYTGIDIDKTRIQEAKKQNPNKHFVSIDAVNENTQLPFDNASFDVVLINDCMHHIGNKDMVYISQEINRILTPNGRIIIREPINDTNIITYMITQIVENGDYTRNSQEYINMFPNYEILYKNRQNIFFREYIALVLKKTDNERNLSAIKINNSNTPSFGRKFMNLITISICIVLLIFIFYIIYVIIRISQNKSHTKKRPKK